MRKSYLALILSAVLFNTTSAFAIGDAGCGLGSVVFSSNKKLLQIFAATTNGTFGSQTFGITSGTSNCTANGFVKVDREQIYYAEANFQNLSIEMAKGTGENLTAFAQVLGCSDKAIPEFGKMTQTKYETIFPNQKTTAIEMLQSVKQQISTDPVLVQECKTRA